MKKSKIDPEDLLQNMNRALDLLKKIEEVENIENLDLKKLKQEADELKENVEKKYMNNLDIKK
tara:strand:- start:72 stop:260 length:189 start_codon:yes stop_codon:yes gene_type:complete